MGFSLFPTRPGTRSPAAVSPILVFSFGWDWQALVCPSLGVIFLLFDSLWSPIGQTASEWWSWELIGRESFSFEDQNGLADEVIMPSRRQPVSRKRFALHSLLMANLKLASDLWL